MEQATLPRNITPDTVLEALLCRIGPANGATVRELASEILGRPSQPSDERLLRQVVVQLRRHGHPVCSTPGQGYHHAANADDLQHTCLHLTHRAVTTLQQVASMKQIAMPDLYGQFGLPIPATTISEDAPHE